MNRSPNRMNSNERQLQNQVDLAEKRVNAITDRSEGLDKMIQQNKENSLKKDTKRAKEFESVNQQFKKIQANQDPKKQEAMVKDEIDNALIRMAENKVAIDMKSEELTAELLEKTTALKVTQEELKKVKEENLRMEQRIRELEEASGLDASAKFVGDRSLLGLPGNSLSGSLNGPQNLRN